MKKLLSLIAMTAATLPIMAGPLSPEEAVARSMSSMKKAPGISMELENAPVYSSVTAAGSPVAYIFNKKGADGYLILSADDLAYPVLGYVEEGSFSQETMAPALKWWLEEYGRQIEFAASKNAAPAMKSPAKSVNSEWEAVPPMVTTRWNQDNPYNLKCPKLNDKLCVTGCVATSMAQVMNYFKYPEVGEGTISYTPTTLKKKLTLNFSKTPFDWDNMLNYYIQGDYTDEQADAVAYLMKACGYATQMQYSPDTSGTAGENIASALRDYFKYDGNCRSEARMPYSWSEWSAMIYNNLKNVGPLVINGSSMYGGHSFVCDGYDGNGYFHFNWGWGGVSDGYYALDALNPSAQGIGGYAGGYNFNQDAIVGIQKPTGLAVEPRPGRLAQYGASIGTMDGDKLIFDVKGVDLLGWANVSDATITVKVGAIIESENSEEQNIVEGSLGSLTRISLNPGTYIPPGSGKPEVTLPALADGKYKVILSSYDVLADDAQWLPVLVEWSVPNYVYVTVENGKYSVEDAPIPEISIKEAEVIGDIYMSCNFKLKAEVYNPYDIEMAQPVSPVLMNGDNVRFTGQSMQIVLNPGEVKEIEWISRFDAAWYDKLSEATQFDFGLINPQTNELYARCGEVTAYPQPDALSVSMSSIGIEDTPTEECTIDGRYFAKVFMVENLEDFMFDLEFSVTRGYFDGQMTISLGEVKVTGQYTYDLLPLGDPVFEEYPFIIKGETYEHHQKLSINDPKDGQLYAVSVQYTSGMSLNTLGTIFLMKAGTYINGIESVVDDNVPVEYYNLQGLRILTPERGEVVIEKRGNSIRKIKL